MHGRRLQIAGISAALLTSHGVHAQDPQAQSIETVTVTGIRGSLDAAREIKRDAAQFVDAIVAADIGKLPDTNVAESLARVSGVQVDRGVAEGTSIAIRGLRENVVLYNGREIFDATGRGGAGLDQLGTSTYGLLALVPSELISVLEVTKLAAANQIAGGLGGIVDIRARKPFDAADTQFVANGAFVYDDLPENGEPELFALYSTTNEDRTIGFLASAAYSQRDLAEHGLTTVSGYRSFSDGGVTRFGNQDWRAQQIAEDREKLGLNAVFQWRPTEQIELTADTFFSRLTGERDRHWLGFNPTAGLTNARYSENNILLSGTATTGLQTNTEFQDNESELWSTAVEAKFEASPRLKGSVEASVGESTAELDRQFLRLTTPAPPVAVDFDFSAGDFGAAAFPAVDLTNPASLNFAILFDDLFRAETDSVQARTDWTLALDGGLLESVDFGLRYSDMETLQNPLRADIRPNLPAALFAPGFLGTFSNPDFLPGDFAGLPRAYLAALESAVTSCSAFTDFPTISQHPQCLDRSISPNSIGSTFLIEEDFENAYGQLNFNTGVGSANVVGNVGVRYVGRDLSSTGNLIAADGSVSEITFERSDDDWLPSAVARVEFNDSLVLRLGAAKVIAYPNTTDLNNGVVLLNNAVFVGGVQVSPGTGSAGAPDLDPFEANQYDASLEFYFAQDALLSAGLFYKDISTFIVQQQSAEVYDGVNFLINRKVNGSEATVQGVELLYQQPFTFFPQPFDGFGAVLTYSYIDSETPITDVTGRALTFPGLSENNVNVVLYYERGPLSARAAYNWRDEYLVSLNASTSTGVFNDTYSDLSASFSYAFTDHLTLGIEGANLLDSEQRTYDGVEEALRTNVVFGRVYRLTLGVEF